MRHSRVKKSIARSDALIKESKSLKEASVQLVACSLHLREGSKNLMERVQRTCARSLAKLPTGTSTVPFESGSVSTADRSPTFQPVTERVAAEIQ